MSDYRHITFSLHTERHKHIIAILDSIEPSKRSEFIRNAIEYYAGLLAKEDSENIDKALFRVIQFEKKLTELEKKEEERYQRILELIQREIEESRKEREELRKELELIKKAQESIRAKEEEERKRKEEEERVKVIEEVKRELKEAVNYFEHAGSKILAFHQIRKMIRDAVERYGLSEDELWEFCFSLSPRLKQQAELEIRRCFR